MIKIIFENIIFQQGAEKFGWDKWKQLNHIFTFNTLNFNLYIIYLLTKVKYMDPGIV